MTRPYYHATPFINLNSIVEAGIRKGTDGVVYLTTEPKDAVKFVAIRGYKEVLVCRVDLEESLIAESFDHNEAFFGCKAWTYGEDIPPESIEEFTKYEW